MNNNTTNDYSEQIDEPLRTEETWEEEPSSNYFLGAKIAVKGLIRNWKQETVTNSYKEYFYSIVWKVMVVLYVLVFIGAIILLPIVLILLLFEPGLIWQVCVMVPLWAFNICQRVRPMQNNTLFIEGLRPLDENTANDFSEKLEENVEIQRKSWGAAVIEGIQEGAYFSLISLCLLVISLLVPFIGSLISAVGETYLVAKCLGWRLVDVYMTGIRKMDDKQKKKFVKRHEKALLGFSLPFTLLCGTPLAGPVFLGYAQAAMADLYHDQIQNREYHIVDDNQV
ncbi:hypothetical protein AKO1_006880 [Acrasis kona]|uniref:Uncharacterized protein n=1 Tax=Acrasis kona TaxID=1008807 RepID=A0AAW2YTC1_9EUKA